MVRKFSLVNSKNETWDLTSQESFAVNPQGLGFQTDTSYMRIGNDSVITYEQYAMVAKTLSIIFMGSTLEEMYGRYNDFVTFLMSKDIYLIYQIPSSDRQYRMRVYVTSLGKGEVSATDSALTCPIQLMPLSFWEDNIENEQTISSLSTMTINSIGTLPTPMNIEVNGSVNNLQYTQTDNENVTLGAGKINGSYSSVKIVSEESVETIELKNGETIVANPYNYQDLTLQAPQLTFLQLVRGTNKIAFAATSFSGTIKIKWRNRYLSV